MTTYLFTHQDCAGHQTAPGHPESPDRVRAILDALDGPAFADLDRRDAPKAEREHLLRLHPAFYIDDIFDSAPESGLEYLDGDTALSPGSVDAALRAAGAVVAAVETVADGGRAFCAVRPPGHHAEPNRAMGFCLFNNVVIGALHAREALGIRKVAVVDFDVHHGNGTQVALWSDAEMFYTSTHQSPMFPGTGSVHETGIQGNILNLPLQAGDGSAEFRQVVSDRMLPALESFAPEFVFISAGFDAHADDPLGGLSLTEADFSWVTEEIVCLAEKTAQGRVVSVLEGGYDLKALGSCAAAHVLALMDDKR